ncbi:malate synthase-like, partial [Pollicipes pollicipes]|uniref:malate synthase-like n=1 Tax=Pollicipes pollicipes TaxID=41117 RepID=UPI001884DD9E
ALPTFAAQSAELQAGWTVAPLPAGLRDRRLDLGDVTPADLARLTLALNTPASGVQVDFDDGHCPTWRNQMLGWHHVMLACSGQLSAPALEAAPVLMIRPRAWNMTEYNVLVDGSPVPGALIDFCVLMFHCGSRLAEAGRGPALYLPKLEAALEARLWAQIFSSGPSRSWAWREERFGACLMIENILAAFEVEEMLYELRDHSLGLNCGMWDYAASFISKFARRPEFVLPDRGPHITMEAPFMAAYLRHMIEVGHRHQVPVTAGMAPQILPDDPEMRNSIITAVVLSKRAEIEAGVDGFLAYDPNLVPALMQLWELQVPRQVASPDNSQLLTLPKGGATSAGLHENVCVTLLFIHAWLHGRGQFAYRSRVEDSATAEICRSQLWQWCRHKTVLTDTGTPVTLEAILEEVKIAVTLLEEAGTDVSDAVPLLKSLIRSSEFVPFITTHLSEQTVIQEAD